MSSASDIIEGWGIPITVCPPRSEIEKLAYNPDYGEEVARKIWIGCLASEYRALQLARLGVRLLQVETKSIALPIDKSADVTPIYREVASAKERKNFETEVGKLVVSAYAEKNPDQLLVAARKLCEVVKGGDRYVSIWVYPVNVKPLELGRGDVRRVRELANRVLETLAPLGGATEAELLKLIASGYRRGVTESISGLSPEAKEFLEELLDKPFERAAILYAFRKLTGSRRLMRRILRDTLDIDTGRHSALSGRIPILKVVNL